MIKEIPNNRKNTIPRMRTIPNAYKEIKALDPNSNLSLRGLRNMIKNKEIPYVKTSANKYLINLDILLDKLMGIDYNNNNDITCNL